MENYYLYYPIDYVTVSTSEVLHCVAVFLNSIILESLYLDMQLLYRNSFSLNWAKFSQIVFAR